MSAGVPGFKWQSASRMKTPAFLVSRHPRLHEHSSASWGLEIVLQLYGKRTAIRHPFQHRRPFPEDDFAPLFLAEMQARGVATGIRSYGKDFAKFEAELWKKRRDGLSSFPLVRVPTVAQVDWATAGLHMRSGTFIVGEENGQPVFLTRPARSATVGQVSLAQMRLLHDSWQRWPVLLPSMLLTVLWHRESGK